MCTTNKNTLCDTLRADFYPTWIFNCRKVTMKIWLILCMHFFAITIGRMKKFFFLSLFTKMPFCLMYFGYWCILPRVANINHMHLFSLYFSFLLLCQCRWHESNEKKMVHFFHVDIFYLFSLNDPIEFCNLCFCLKI